MAESSNSKFWDIRSRIYDGNVIGIYEEAYKKTIERTKKYLKSTDRVLDIGCGTGVTTIPLSAYVEHMTAIDTSSGMMDQAVLKAAQGGIHNIDFHSGEMFMEVLKPGEFDAVMMFNVLLYMSDQAAAMKRITELLKPGGYFFVAADCLKYSLSGDAIKKWFKSHSGRMPHVEFFTPLGLEKQVKECGLKIIETEKLFKNPVNYYIVARKI